jgi:hypothetical protein
MGELDSFVSLFHEYYKWELISGADFEIDGYRMDSKHV